MFFLSLMFPICLLTFEYIICVENRKDLVKYLSIQGYLARKSFAGNFLKCVFLSFHNYKIVFKSEFPILLKPNKLTVAIRKETCPRTTRIQFDKFSVQVVPCKMFLCLPTLGEDII